MNNTRNQEAAPSSELSLLQDKELDDLKRVLTDFASVPPRDSKVHQEIVSSWGYCAICQKRKHQVKKLTAAHIKPREEDGRDEAANMLCLCFRDKRSLRTIEKSIEEVGCHDLFDRYQVWTRKEMDGLRQLRGAPCYAATASAYEAMRSQAIKSSGVWQFTNNRDWSIARGELELQIAGAGSEGRKTELLLKLVRVERKAAKKDRLQTLNFLFREARRVLANVPPDQLLRERGLFDYELGMIHFQLRQFQKAAKLLGKSVNAMDQNTLINDAQRCVAAFEDTKSQGGNVLLVEELLKKLILVSAEIDARCNSLIKQIAAEHDEAKRRDLEDSLKTLKSWGVDSRLHAARIAAWLRKPETADCLFNEAVQRRESGDLEPSVFTVLKLAEGDVRRAAGDYENAQKALARAGMKLVVTQHKEFEYLENVLDGLLALPEARCPQVSQHGEQLRCFRKRLSEHVGEINRLWDELSRPVEGA